MNPLDNVLVALQPLQKGQSICFDKINYLIQSDISPKHKFYMHDMIEGEEVIMYGVLVGKVTTAVKSGTLMTTQNLSHAAEPFVFKPYNYTWNAPDTSNFAGRTFLGYQRSDGTVGTANYWLFIPTVFCENRNLDVIKEALHNELGYADTPKYKAFTKKLVQAYQEGVPIDTVASIDLSANTKSNNRVFLSIIQSLKSH